MTVSSQAAPLPPFGEHRQKAFELSHLKVAGEGEPAGTFTGIASAVGVLDRHNEIIEPGAFDSGLAAKGARYTLLWQHDPGEPIGVIDVSTDQRGDLVAKGSINLDTQRGMEAYSLLKQGAINSMSIGFNIPDGALKWDDDAKLVRILAVDLWEVSLVTFPANPAAIVDGVKDALTLAHAKAGKVLSAANASKVQTAIDALQAVLDAADTTSGKTADLPQRLCAAGDNEAQFACPNCAAELVVETLAEDEAEDTDGAGSKSIGPPSTESELDGIKKLAADLRAQMTERVTPT